MWRDPTANDRGPQQWHLPTVGPFLRQGEVGVWHTRSCLSNLCLQEDASLVSIPWPQGVLAPFLDKVKKPRDKVRMQQDANGYQLQAALHNQSIAQEIPIVFLLGAIICKVVSAAPSLGEGEKWRPMKTCVGVLGALMEYQLYATALPCLWTSPACSRAAQGSVPCISLTTSPLPLALVLRVSLVRMPAQLRAAISAHNVYKIASGAWHSSAEPAYSESSDSSS